MSNGNDYAYPQSEVFGGSGEYETRDVGGLTKREYFAAAAMQGLLAGDTELQLSPAGCAEAATEYADALLAALWETQS